MTSEEKQEIINAVLAALRTNSKTISQLTPVSSLSDDDSIEIGGGKRVTYAVLKSLIEVLYSAAISNGINANNEIYFSGSKLKMSAVPDELNAALNEYFEACVRQDSDHLVDLLYSRIVLLDSMGSELDGLTYTPVAGDLVWRNGYVFKWNGTAWEDGAVQPRKHVLYINKHTGKRYMWTGTTMQELQGSSSSDTGSISAFADYAVAESVSALPATGVATTGYIVGNHIYAYVGTGGDTRDGKYQDLGTLEAAGVSVTTAEDGTFTIHVGGNDYTVNLNHTHENMAKLVVCEESDLPSTLDPATIYALVDDASEPTAIQSLWIAGLEFVGGSSDPDEPKLSPADGRAFDLGQTTNGVATMDITVKGINLTQALTAEITSGSGYSLTYGQQSGASVTIPAADALVGATLTLTYTGNDTDENAAGVLSIASTEVQSDCDLITNKVEWTDVDWGVAKTINAFPANGGAFYSGKLSKSVSVDGYTKMKLTPSASGAIYLLCKTEPPESPADSSSYVGYLCSGLSNRSSSSAGSTYIIDLPSDCKFVVFGINASGPTGDTYKPTLVQFR